MSSSNRGRYSGYRLQIALLYGNYSFFERPGTGLVVINSICQLSKVLGIDSKRVNQHLAWLESNGYIRKMEYSPNKRSVALQLELPRA